MTLLIHITIALLSVITTTYLFFSPSKRALHVSYALVTMTLVSGTYLVIDMHAGLVQACTNGLFYLAVVSVGLVLGSRKLTGSNSTAK